MIDIDRLKHQIAGDLKGASCLKQLCTRISASKETLRKEFRKKEGMPISHFIAQVRIERMKSLLSKTGLSCKEICCEVGIEKESGARTFKRITGMTMMGYREFIKVKKRGNN
ncbi:MAG: helix-turn-helix domain-containing protein [Candidatus Kryptoniota bacterium]